jgi:undecaprenyl-phosphate 4-deoxy-4-formamido-L-arabinose transferase
MTKLSIVIPVYNAEKTIESLCNTLIHLYGASTLLEIVLVNDCSSDSTDIICQRLHTQHRDIITYLRLSRNFSEHNAVMAGLNHVTGDLCVIMDDDFQNPPEEIKHLLREMEKGYDVVYTRYPQKQDHPLRNIGSMINDKMANLILKKPANLYLSSFKIMNRFLVNELIKYTGPDPYIDAIILRSTVNIGSILVRHDQRRHGRSGYTMKKLISLWGNMMVSFSLIPLRVLGIAGLLMAIYGVISASGALLDYLLPNSVDPSDLETLTAITAFFRGFQMLAISIVGEYIGRIYLALNRDPQFIIREKFTAVRKAPIVSVHSREKGAANAP